MTETPALPTPSSVPASSPAWNPLAAIPEEEVWLASQKNARTRRAYKFDVSHFMKTLGITTPDLLRQVNHRAIITWERIMRDAVLAFVAPYNAEWLVEKNGYRSPVQTRTPWQQETFKHAA